MNKVMILTVYTHDGHTFQFRNVDNVSPMNKVLHFTYIGVRSGKVTEAVFHNVAGWTIAEAAGKPTK